MAKEKAKSIYLTKPKKFGNGARIKAFKEHIGDDVIVFNKKRLDDDEYLTKLWDKTEKKHLKKLIKEIKELDNIIKTKD